KSGPVESVTVIVTFVVNGEFEPASKAPMVIVYLPTGVAAVVCMLTMPVSLVSGITWGLNVTVEFGGEPVTESVTFELIFALVAILTVKVAAAPCTTVASVGRTAKVN